jgi:hypothetical protein
MYKKEISDKKTTDSEYSLRIGQGREQKVINPTLNQYCGARAEYPKLRISAPDPAPASFYLSKTYRNFIEKISVAEDGFVNCYDFYPIRVKHASIQVKNKKGT